MKLTMKLLVLFFGVLMLANIANAESPREQLKQMVGQLQQNPDDNALREKIIKLAQKIKPAPAIPEEAEKFEGRAQFAFKNAKSPADYLDAANEYEKGITAAPWVAGYYADLCTIYEKAEKYAEAKKSCEFFLASSPSAQDASDVRKRIAGLEFAMEKVSKQKNQAEDFLKKLDGARFVYRFHNEDEDSMEIIEIRGNMAVKGFMSIANTYHDQRYKPVGVMKWDNPGYLITGREVVIPRSDPCIVDEPCYPVRRILNISEDGNRITERWTRPKGELGEVIYLREK